VSHPTSFRKIRNAISGIARRHAAISDHKRFLRHEIIISARMDWLRPSSVSDHLIDDALPRASCPKLDNTLLHPMYER